MAGAAIGARTAAGIGQPAVVVVHPGYGVSAPHGTRGVRALVHEDGLVSHWEASAVIPHLSVALNGEETEVKDVPGKGG